MSFKVNLYAFSKEANSTKQPTGTGTEYTCVSNDDLDVLNPRVPLNIGNSANPSSYNYMKIPDFGRYYWIRTWKFESGLWVAYCQVDPLASWKSGIGSTSAYVLRAAAAYDGSIIDNMYPKTSTIVKESDIDSKLWDTDPQTTGTFIVGVMGHSTINYYCMTPALLWAFMNDIYDPYYYTSTLGFFSLTNQDLITLVDPLQYIASVVWLPFTAANGGSATSLYVGVVDVETINGIIYDKMAQDGFTTLTVSFTPSRHPLAATRGSWMNTAMADYTVTIPPFGTISLDPAQVANADTIRCYITVDHRSGAGLLRIEAVDTLGDFHYLAHITGQVGITFPLSHITTPGAALASTILPAFKAAGGAMTALTGAASGNAGALMGGVGTALGGVASALGDLAQTKIPHTSTTGGTPSVASLITYPQMDYTWYYPADEDNTHKGRPLCKVRTLSTLSGYQLCTNVDLQLPATREEIDMVRQYLESGYYYE